MQPQGIFFIEKNGLTILGCDETIRLMDIYEQGYIGEFESIFNQVAERSCVAVNKKDNASYLT